MNKLIKLKTVIRDTIRLKGRHQWMNQSILTWRRVSRDQEGGGPGSSRAHCTPGHDEARHYSKTEQMGRVIFGSGGLRSRYAPFIIKQKIEAQTKQPS